MIKKIILITFMLFCGAVESAQVVNVEYIHNVIAQKWDISVPYNSELTNPRVVANMKYLLTAIDVANEMLNGEKMTDYGNGEYATTVAADVIAVDTAVETLVQEIDTNQLIMTVGPSRYTGNDNNDFAFAIAAAGTFYVDWGDGTTQVIEKPDSQYVEYRHTYPADNEYRFCMRGAATEYGSNTSFITGSYSGSARVLSDFWVLKVRGCLGCVFPTLADGTQPNFTFAFAWQSNLTGKLPTRFFAGIHGQLREGMFVDMFASTGLTSIGAPLFDDLSSGMAESAFFGMFRNCSNLTGESAKMRLSDGTIKYLYEVYPDATYDQVGACYYGTTGLSDYANMPRNWTYWDM